MCARLCVYREMVRVEGRGEMQGVKGRKEGIEGLRVLRGACACAQVRVCVFRIALKHKSISLYRREQGQQQKGYTSRLSKSLLSRLPPRKMTRAYPHLVYCPHLHKEQQQQKQRFPSSGPRSKGKGRKEGRRLDRATKKERGKRIGWGRTLGLLIQHSFVRTPRPPSFGYGLFELERTGRGGEERVAAGKSHSEREIRIRSNIHNGWRLQTPQSAHSESGTADLEGLPAPNTRQKPSECTDLSVRVTE